MYGLLLAVAAAMGQVPVASIETIVVVSIDAEAVLFIQDNESKWFRSKTTGTKRRLITPPCSTAAEWSYLLRAELPSGKTITRRIVFRPGKGIVNVNLTD